MQQEREQFFGQIAALQAENELLRQQNRQLQQHNQELQQENQELKEQNQELKEQNQVLHVQNQQLQQHNQVLDEQHHQLQQENQELQEQLQVVVPAVPDYLGVRDRILKNWRIAKAPEKKERIMSALDKFIEAVTESTQISTPGSDHDTSH